ncbi:uncharacterized protein LOC110100480 isoform X1 [Dendrobium catenatum]|uniref:Cyclin-D1-binding protein 1 n=2 Tax=Dendrobium catenatum TaxID=906689 RepID=A0A2I0X427_9ASPA|nr:uncharacterized protein LOC110100480 isoform X1 [Dendrobium catenatum]PKU82666.1 hypothetical protein MA16_Dca018824 [Dendrobium catenatum]
MSARGGKKARLSRALDSHIRNIEETFQILEKSAASSLEKVEWSQVIKLGDEVSKQATIAGMLWSVEEPEMKQLEECMEAYFNVLHGFVLICHGSTAGAGPTLHASICSSARQVIDSSLALLKEALSIESRNFSNRSSIIPRLSGSVWEACANLNKNPTSNCTAIGRAITRVAVSVKDILREMNELKPAAPNTSNDASPEEDDSDDEEFGDDLSPEEMLIAQLTTKAVSDVLAALKEVIRFVSGLHTKSNEENMEHVKALETLLRCCEEIGNQANELGASVYPPQEISVLKSAAKKIYIAIDDLQKVVEIVGGSDQSFLGCFERLEDSLKKMESGLCGDVSSEIERLAL